MNRFLIHLILIFAVISTLFIPVNAAENIELVISRSKHQLVVKKDGINIRTFKVAFGSGGRKAKLREGDHTTPKGKYRISKIRSSDRFHMFMQLNYPNMDDANRAFKNHSISSRQYQAILDAHTFGQLPPQNTALGGAIGIHGIGDETSDRLEIHQISDWTQGCIAMRNHEIDDLSRYITVGTQINIID